MKALIEVRFNWLKADFCTRVLAEANDVCVKGSVLTAKTAKELTDGQR